MPPALVVRARAPAESASTDKIEIEDEIKAELDDEVELDGRTLPPTHLFLEGEPTQEGRQSSKRRLLRFPATSCCNVGAQPMSVSLVKREIRCHWINAGPMAKMTGKKTYLRI